MPTPTIGSALIKLTCLDFPWNLPTWQALTGVKHGIFPDDPTHLPKGWTPEDAQNVKSFIDQYSALPTEDAKLAFVSQRRGAALPGRKKWKDFVSSLWRSSGIHDKIIAVFSANSCHPLALSLEQTDDASTWPQGATWIPVCLDAIALELFGEESLNKSGRLPERFRGPTQTIAQRTWSNLTKRLERCQKRFAICQQEALEAFNDLDDQTLTRSNITAVIRAVAKWRNVVEILDTKENIAKIEEMELELDRLMEGLGAQVSEEKKKKKKKAAGPQLFKLSNEMLKSLATEKAVQDVILLYHEYFDNPSNAADDIPIIDREQATQNKFALPADGVDTGVELEATMRPEKLQIRLGFVDGIPLLFNPLRHTDGLTAWANPEALKFDPENPNRNPALENLDLHWHQLAGVHAIIRMCFTSEPLVDHCTGVLVADEVGLGKTYQSATVIAFLADTVIRQARGYKVAPLLESYPYLAGTKDVPSLPHLIIVPGTLLAQWLKELHILFSPGSVDIFTYPTSREACTMFWAADGPFYSSRHSLSNRIILAPHSALQKDFTSLYSMKAKKYGALPWATPPLLSPKLRADISDTLFGHDYLSITLDEAHNFRNHGAKHSAALAILDKTIVRLILTATPLQTSTKDLAAMGRLTGIPHFLDEGAWEEEKEDMRSLRRARKELPDDYDPLEENDQDPIKLCQVVIAQRMQRQSQGHILRRTTDSLNWKGKALVPLPECKTVYAYLDLTPRELKTITASGQSLRESVGTANMSMKLFTRGFYMEYRTSVVYARENPHDEIPVFKSLDEWENLKSTKLDTAARLCRYLLTRDDLPTPKFENGTVAFPAIPPIREGETITQNCKIVVFSEFPSMISLFKNIFDLYGIKVLAINGSMSFEKRASIVKTFREDPTYRVLAMSAVGTTGINLAFCRVLIFLDQPWSAQEVRQTRGRIHRQPQKHKVLCIHLLANDTADIIVSGMAQGKRDMMEAYLSKRAGQEMFELLSGGGAGIQPDMDTDEEDEPAAKQKKPKKSRPAQEEDVLPPLVPVPVYSEKRKAKAKAVEEEEDEEEEEEVAISIALTRKNSKPKSKVFVDDSDDDDIEPPQKPQPQPQPIKKASTVGDAPLAKQSKAKKSKPVVEDQSDVEVVPPSKKVKPKSKRAVEDDEEEAEADIDEARPAKKSKAPKSKPTVQAEVTLPSKKLKRKSQPAVEDDEEVEASTAAKPKPAVQVEVVPASKKSKPKSKPAQEVEENHADIDDAPLTKKRKTKSRPAVEEEQDDENTDVVNAPVKNPRTIKPKPAVQNPAGIKVGPPSKKPKPKAKPAVEEEQEDEEAVDVANAPPVKKSMPKRKPAKGNLSSLDANDDDLHAVSTSSVSKSAEAVAEDDMFSQTTDKFMKPGPEDDNDEEEEHACGNEDRNERRVEDNDDDDDVDDDEDTHSMPKSRATGFAEEEDDDDTHRTDRSANPSDVDLPAPSDFSSNISGLSRSNSRRSFTSSNVSMRSRGASDASMGDIAPDVPPLSPEARPMTPPNAATPDPSPGSVDREYLSRKRSFPNASPTSPLPAGSGHHGNNRRRVSLRSDDENYYKKINPRDLPRPSQFIEFQKTVPRDESLKKMPPLVPLKAARPPPRPPAPTEQAGPRRPFAYETSLTAASQALAQKQRASKDQAADISKQPLSQPSEKAHRDSASTYTRLQGYSGRDTTIHAGSSSVSAPLQTSSARTNAIAGPSGASIPVHRQPASFQRRTVSPPPPLGAKKPNPFGAQYKPGAKKQNKSRW